MEKIITYFGQELKIACDEKCNKAFGIINRPRINLDENDFDDYVFLSDDEIGEAPKKPCSMEEGNIKPSDTRLAPNNWCIQECERCEIAEINLKLKLPNFSKRVYNISWKNMN